MFQDNWDEPTTTDNWDTSNAANDDWNVPAIGNKNWNESSGGGNENWNEPSYEPHSQTGDWCNGEQVWS